MDELGRRLIIHFHLGCQLVLFNKLGVLHTITSVALVTILILVASLILRKTSLSMRSSLGTYETSVLRLTYQLGRPAEHSQCLMAPGSEHRGCSSSNVRNFEQPEDVKGIGLGSQRLSCAIGRSMSALTLVTPGQNSICIVF